MKAWFMKFTHEAVQINDEVLKYGGLIFLMQHDGKIPSCYQEKNQLKEIIRKGDFFPILFLGLN